MVQRIRKYTSEECGRRGREIYDRVIRPKLTEVDRGKFVAIDVDTEAFEIGLDDLTVGAGLREVNPQAQIFMLRAGYKAAYKMGGGSLTQEPLP